MQRIKEIDGIRGIAILLVISFHYINNQLVDSTNQIGRIMAKLTYFGWVGVDLFFVLSGFLIGSVLLNNKLASNYFSTFYLRRALRIIPNYFLLLTLFLIINVSGLFLNNYFLTGNNVIPIWSYFLMVHNLFMASINNLGNDSICVTWSIGIEEQFYLIIPLLLWKINTKWIPYLMIFFIVISIFFRFQYENWIDKYVLLICRADSLSLGVIISWINHKYDIKSLVINLKNTLIFILVLLILISGLCYYLYNDLGPFKHTLFSMVFAIFILFALGFNNNNFGKILRNRTLCSIGTISYSLYLFHYFILGLVHQIDGKNGIIISNFKDVALTIVAFFISILFSLFVYKFFESPLINFGKKIKY